MFPFFGPFLLHLAWDGETRTEAHGPGEDLSFGVRDLEGVCFTLLFFTCVIICECVCIALRARGGGFKTQQLDKGVAALMLRAMCPFQTAPRFSGLVLCQQTVLVGQNQMGHPLPVPLVLFLVPACHLLPLVPALGSCSLWNRLEPRTYFSSFCLHVCCENFSCHVCVFWFATQKLIVTISCVASWVASSVSINMSEISLLA